MSDFLRLYKFYSSKYALRNLEQRRLKISTLGDLNDPFEYRSMSFPDTETRKSWERCRKNMFANSGIICFCKRWSNPVIWSHYAENHRGLALGFDVPRTELTEVKYRKSRRKIPVSSLRSSDALCHLNREALAIKYAHWSYEEEFRWLVDARNRDPKTGLYFKDFADDLTLREIVIGAESQLTCDDISRKTGIKGIEYTTARLAFKSYRVVKQNLPSLQK